MSTMGEKLKKIRIEKGLTQKQVAELVGHAISTISAYESGDRFPPYDVLLKLSQFYGVTTDYLISDSDVRSLNLSGLQEDEIALVTQMVAMLQKKRR